MTTAVACHSTRLAGNPFRLVDLQARRVHYLRVSVTDRCNYRCTYCMPAEGVAVVPRDELLRFDEIARLVRLFVELGVRKVRLTGGEPLVRRDVVELVAMLAQVPGVDDLAMTTNGHLLPELARPLREAGLQRLNVSVDTLDAANFARVTRLGSLAQVMAGLDAADAAGFRHTKLNAVVQRGANDHELVALADFASARGYILRLIEHMPIGTDEAWTPASFVSLEEMRQTLQSAWELQPDGEPDLPGGGPARYWRGVRRDTGASLRLGLIGAVSEGFCASCNRVRLSAQGTLRECLSTAGALSLRDLMRAGADDDTLRQAILDGLMGKVDGHRFDHGVRTREAMSSIGG